MLLPSCLPPCSAPCEYFRPGPPPTVKLQANKTADKLFGDKKPQEPTEPAFVTEAKLKWNVSPPAGLACWLGDGQLPACLLRGCWLAAALLLASGMLAACLLPTHALHNVLLTRPQHPLSPHPLQLATKAVTKQPADGDSGASGSSDKPRPKRSDRYSSKELASKQRLAELVEQHKAGLNKSGSFKAPTPQATRR